MYNNYNPYIGMQRPFYQATMPQQEQIQQIPPQQYNQPIKQGLQGKMVEGIDVVKGIDILYDGSVSYFPTSDGTKIFTKQMMYDGSVKINTFKLEQEENENIQPKYATIEDIEEIVSKLNYKTELDEIKKYLSKEKK